MSNIIEIFVGKNRKVRKGKRKTKPEGKNPRQHLRNSHCLTIKWKSMYSNLHIRKTMMCVG